MASDEQRVSVKRDIPEQLDEAQKVIRELKESLDEETTLLRKEREDFEDKRKKLNSVHFSKNIKLNVGGQIFKTSLETLRKDPDSMLAAMFSERFDIEPDEDDGAYFIDRDGTHFRYILNYLRTGQLFYPKENKVLAAELFLEAEFYQVNHMQSAIFGPKFRNSPVILGSLTAAQKEALESFIPTPCLSYWNVLFSEKSYGWSPSDFHSLCNSKGPTVVLAKNGKYVFGGYSHKSWNSNCSHMEDKASFLFTLANKTGAAPMKMTQVDGGGVWGHPLYGPAFGTASGISISFMDNNQPNYCGFDATKPSGFQLPPGQTIGSFISGAMTGNSFAISNLEVFGLKEHSW